MNSWALKQQNRVFNTCPYTRSLFITPIHPICHDVLAPIPSHTRRLDSRPLAIDDAGHPWRTWHSFRVSSVLIGFIHEGATTYKSQRISQIAYSLDSAHKTLGFSQLCIQMMINNYHTNENGLISADRQCLLPCQIAYWYLVKSSAWSQCLVLTKWFIGTSIATSHSPRATWAPQWHP